MEIRTQEEPWSTEGRILSRVGINAVYGDAQTIDPDRNGYVPGESDNSATVLRRDVHDATIK